MTEHEKAVSGEQSPEQIESEIQRTRERMSSNLDELGGRLSPDSLKQQAKEAISEKAQEMVAGVGAEARQTGVWMANLIAENPLPVAAVGLGAIWAFSLRRGRSAVSGHQMRRFAYTGPERRDANALPGLGRRLADRASSVRQSVSERVSDVGERAGELKGRVQERVSELGITARDAQGGVEHMMNDNPLVVVAGAAMIGIALGLMIPETETERRVMGDQRDEIVDRVQRTAGVIADGAVEAGRTLQQTVRDEVSQRAPGVKDALTEVAATVKDQLKDSASRTAGETKREILGEGEEAPN